MYIYVYIYIYIYIYVCSKSRRGRHLPECTKPRAHSDTCRHSSFIAREPPPGAVGAARLGPRGMARVTRARGKEMGARPRQQAATRRPRESSLAPETEDPMQAGRRARTRTKPRIGQRADAFHCALFPRCLVVLGASRGSWSCHCSSSSSSF